MGPQVNANSKVDGEIMKSKLKEKINKDRSVISNKIHSLFDDIVSANVGTLLGSRLAAAASDRNSYRSRRASGDKKKTTTSTNHFHYVTGKQDSFDSGMAKIYKVSANNKYCRGVHPRKLPAATSEIGNKRKNLIFQIFSDIDYKKSPRKSKKALPKKMTKRNTTSGYFKRPLSTSNESNSSRNLSNPESGRRSFPPSSSSRFFGRDAFVRNNDAVHETHIIKIFPKRMVNKRNNYGTSSVEHVKRPNCSDRWDLPHLPPFLPRTGFNDKGPGDGWELSGSMFEEEILPFHERNEFTMEDIFDDETRNLFDDVFNLFRMFQVPFLDNAIYLKLSTTEEPQILYPAVTTNSSTESNLHSIIQSLRNKRQAARYLASHNISLSTSLPSLKKNLFVGDDVLKEILSLKLNYTNNPQRKRVKKDNGSAETPVMSDNASSSSILFKNTSFGNVTTTVDGKFNYSYTNTKASVTGDINEFNDIVGLDKNKSILMANRGNTEAHKALTIYNNNNNSVISPAEVLAAKGLKVLKDSLPASPTLILKFDFDSDESLKWKSEERGNGYTTNTAATVAVDDGQRKASVSVTSQCNQTKFENVTANDTVHTASSLFLRPSSVYLIAATALQNQSTVNSEDDDDRKEDNLNKPNLIDLLDVQENEGNPYEENVALKSMEDGGVSGGDSANDDNAGNPSREQEASTFLIVLGIVPGLLGIIIVGGVILVWMVQKKPEWFNRGRESGSPRNETSFQTSQQQQLQKSSVQC